MFRPEHTITNTSTVLVYYPNFPSCVPRITSLLVCPPTRLFVFYHHTSLLASHPPAPHSICTLFPPHCAYHPPHTLSLYPILTSLLVAHPNRSGCIPISPHGLYPTPPLSLYPIPTSLRVAHPNRPGHNPISPHCLYQNPHSLCTVSPPHCLWSIQIVPAVSPSHLTACTPSPPNCL